MCVCACVCVCGYLKQKIHKMYINKHVGYGYIQMHIKSPAVQPKSTSGSSNTVNELA